MKKTLIFSTILVLILNGCGSSTDDKSSNQAESSTPPTTTEVSNKAPIVHAGEDKNVIVNETITITGTATDSDGTIVSYEWTKGNDILSASATLNYTPINVGTDILTFTAIDDNNNVATDNIKLFVNEDDSSEDTGRATIEQN